MLGRGALVLTLMCGCAQLGPAAGWESSSALASSLAGWNGDYAEKKAGGWDMRMGLAVPYESKYLIVGPRFDAIWVRYFKAESFSLELGIGACFMADTRPWEEGAATGGWVYIVPVSGVAKYFFELIYKSGFRMYVGAGLGLYWAGVIGMPGVELDIPIAVDVPFCFGIQLSREERSVIEIEFRFDGLAGPAFEGEAVPPATRALNEVEARLGVFFISVNWKGVF